MLRVLSQRHVAFVRADRARRGLASSPDRDLMERCDVGDRRLHCGCARMCVCACEREKDRVDQESIILLDGEHVRARGVHMLQSRLRVQNQRDSVQTEDA